MLTMCGTNGLVLGWLGRGWLTDCSAGVKLLFFGIQTRNLNATDGVKLSIPLGTGTGKHELMRMHAWLIGTADLCSQPSGPSWQ